MRKQDLTITPERIGKYAAHLQEQERAAATIEKYVHDLTALSVFLPDKLRKLLRAYLQKQKITAGAVFISRNGKPLNRSNIWRDMKALCESAGVEAGTEEYPVPLKAIGVHDRFSEVGPLDYLKGLFHLRAEDIAAAAKEAIAAKNR